MAPESGYYGNTGVTQNAGDTSLPNGQEAINSPDFLQNGSIGNLGYTTSVPPPPASVHETALRSDEENSAVLTTPQNTGLSAATAGFTQIQPSPTDNYNFNQIQFIQDTQ